MSDLTSEQRRAVEARGKIIVSASAGSGKTFVMIERLVELISSGADIKRILAVTFTNRAAAQIKERLRGAILRRLKDSDGEQRARLKAQLAALPMADISTIHSFCARVVRSYFYLIGIDPAFRIVSEESMEGNILYSRALDEVFENCYEEHNESFSELLNVYFYKKKDEKLKRILRALYKDLRKSVNFYEILQKTGEEDLFEGLCTQIKNDFCARITFLRERNNSLSERLDPTDKLFGIVCEQEMALCHLEEKGDLFALSGSANFKLSFSRMPFSSKYEGKALEDYNEVKSLSERIKELYGELCEFSDADEERRRYENARKLSRALAELLLKFDETLERLKKENGVLDYNDLEKYAYQILQNEEARSAIAARYDYLFVDEYQDVNAAQEAILNLVSQNEIFLVGDAKQAIYAFRGSRSEFFIKRREETEHSLSITENFRSAPAILQAVNEIFSQSMTKQTSGIDYAHELMRGGSRYGGHDGKVCFYCIPKETKKAREGRGIYDIWAPREEEYDLQAEFVADLVLKEAGTEWYDADKGCTKPIGLKDIALLVRNNTGDAQRLIKALSRRNIPVTTSAKVNVCDFWEARLLIDVLSYLDNPEQDIPLSGALLSEIGGMTESELCRVREAFPAAKNFRTACREYARREDTIALKLHTFFEKTQKFRALMQVRSCAEVAELLLAEGLEAEILAKKDGRLRKIRVNRLIGEMQGSVGEFLRRLKAVGYKIEYSENGAEDAVKVMTVHASKGLEFPVVILINLDTLFHGEKEEVLFTEKYSIAPKSYDQERGVMYENILRRASLLQMEQEERKGELNLFYVAMTRAKYRLHVVFRDREQGDAVRARRFSDFVDFDVCEKYFTEPEPSLSKKIEHSELVYRPDEKILETIQSVYRKKYPYEESVRLPLKSSATRIMEEEESHTELAKTGRGGSTVEEGLAYHAFLQHVNFSESAKSELARMERENLLSAEQIAQLKIENLEKILALSAIKALKNRQVLREQKFLAMIPASELYEADCQDEILVQGAIDALVQSDDGWVILDYKFSARGREEIKQSYAKQIEIYRKAAARALKIDISTIKARILNIRRFEEIEM